MHRFDDRNCDSFHLLASPWRRKDYNYRIIDRNHGISDRLLPMFTRLGSIHIFFLSSVFIIISIFNHQGGVFHPELEVYIPHYLSDRPLLNKLYDSKITEAGLFRARELSYLVDFIDIKFFALSVNLGFPHFLSLSHYIFSLIIAILLWRFSINDIRLDKTISTLLILLLLTSTYFFLGGILFRSAKIGVALFAELLLIIIYKFLNQIRLIPAYKINLPTWLLCFGLSWTMSLFDEQGIYFVILIIAFLLFWIAFSFSRNILLLLSSFVFSLLANLLYHSAAARLTFYFNGYFPDNTYQSNLPLRDYFSNFCTYLSNGEFLFLETIRHTIGNFPYNMFIFPMIFSIGLLFWAGLKEWINYRAGRKPVFLIFLGLFIIFFLLIPLMNSLMLLRHPPLLNIRDTYYLLPTATLIILTLPVLISYLNSKNVSRRLIILVLMVVIIGNLIHVPNNTAQMKEEILPWYEYSAEMIEALRHKGDKNIRVPDAIANDPVYRLFTAPHQN